MIIAISGTPGVGKHYIGRMLSKKLGYEFVDLNKKINKREISLSELNAAARKIKDNTVVVSHLVHLVTSKKFDLLIILRCRPDVLEKRLRKRGYGKRKIYDNLMFEVIDGTYAEAVDWHKKAIQVDNTKDWRGTLKKIILAMKGKYRSERIDYSDYILSIEKRFNG